MASKRLRVFKNFTGTALEYTDGFNVNGIATSGNGKFLVLAKSNTSGLVPGADLQPPCDLRSTCTAKRSRVMVSC